MGRLLELPIELIENVLRNLDPYDVVAFSRTSQHARTLVSPSNQILWRHAFLHIFDDPTDAWARMLPTLRSANAKIETDWNWYLQVRERCTALQSLRSPEESQRRTRLLESTDALVQIIETASLHPADRRLKAHSDDLDSSTAASSRSVATLRAAFDSSYHSEKLFRSFERKMSSLSHSFNDDGSYTRPNPRRPFTRSMVPDPEPLSDNSSRLHIYYGLTDYERTSGSAQAAALRIVYDYGTAAAQNDYGPFVADSSGRIDWKLLEAISSTIGFIFERMMEDHLRVPQGLAYALPYQVGIDPDCPEDWAGATRRWLGTYSFIDYTVLHQINVAFQRGFSPSLERIDEAHGDLLALHLSLDDSLKTDERLQSDLPVCEDLPVLYFSGRSQASSSTTMFTFARGRASLVPGGRFVRWRFIIRYGGMDQWQLEGIQPGGIRSGGIFGRWTHCDHDGDGPVGPFCYFPADLCEPVRSKSPY